ncbi:MAG: hypothetical protein AAF915_13880 [Cyanobacteria bacterium P01_D01_bin.50]
MPEIIIAEIIGQLLYLVAETAIIFWNQLLEWVYINVVIWIEIDLNPLLMETAKIAFMALNKVRKSTYQMIQQAWNTLRQSLLEIFVEFHLSSSNIWSRNLTSVLIKVLESGQTVLLKREVEENVSWDDLPSDVRAAWLRSTQTSYKINF